VLSKKVIPLHFGQQEPGQLFIALGFPEQLESRKETES
jgi:hypothetical protein